MKYRLINNITGWALFVVAAYVYITTIEPTASFWDCGEFIATANKLEVGHPPGAPLFMIMGRFFSMFAVSPQYAAMMVNTMSALASALTILFLFWTVTHFARKIYGKMETEMSMGGIIAIMGSGIIGGLAYTFSDTFWFSAVEGEVYASSSLFTAAVFWAILKWEDVADEKYADRWIVLIAFLMGLSIGVHLLNLLAIPAIVFVYYFKKYKPTPVGLLASIGISVVLLAVVMYGIIPGTITMASYFELIFVNGIGTPYNVGVLIYAILLLASLILGLYFTFSKGPNILRDTVLFSAALILLGVPLISKSFLLVLIIPAFIAFAYFMALKFRHFINTILLCFMVILVGYSSFAMIVIRSSADPPMDENSPDNVFALLDYLNREQYGDRPLFYGQYFNAKYVEEDPYIEGAAKYVQKGNRYVVASHKTEVNYEKKFKTIFPRMFSNDDRHVDAYLQWADLNENDLWYDPGDPRDGKRSEPKEAPGLFSNIKFFFKYQVGWMYFRYFMWNFSGRQNDIQGHGNNIHGNFITGIRFIDEAMLGPQDIQPPEIVGNRANNKFYLLPLILGLIGLIYQLQRNGRGFLVVMLLFLFTGLAIVVYLNQTPYQPRERDYAYAGSFYAFAIWIGLGVFALYDAAKNLQWKNYLSVGAIGLGVSLFFLLASAFSSTAFIICSVVFIMTVFYLVLFGLFKLLGSVNIRPLHAVLAILVAAPVPYVLAKENWDDHDRSNRYIARDFAKNYLTSCAKQAVLITYGDNDTFPLWYAQEVEGVRTDMKVLCFTLFNTDWYIDQMARKTYESEGMNFSLNRDQYVQGTRDMIYVAKDADKSMFIMEKFQTDKRYAVVYNQIFAQFSSMLENSKFPELHQKDYELIKKGPKTVNILMLSSLIGKIYKEKSFDKYGISEEGFNAFRKSYNEFMGQIMDDPIPLKSAIACVLSDDPRFVVPQRDSLRVIPGNTFRIPVDSAKVIANGTVRPEDAGLIVPYIDIKISGNWLQKNELMFLDFLAQNDWDRPVYLTSIGDMAFSLRDYLQLEGFAYRLVPIRTKGNVMEFGRIDADSLYPRLMNQFTWGNINDPKVYLDETIIRTTPIVRIRNTFCRLSEKMLAEGKKAEAVKVLDKLDSIMPHFKIPYDFNNIRIAEAYYKADAPEKANAMIQTMYDFNKQVILYYLSVNEELGAAVENDRDISLRIMNDIVELTNTYKQPDLYKKLADDFNALSQQLMSRENMMMDGAPGKVKRPG